MPVERSHQRLSPLTTRFVWAIIWIQLHFFGIHFLRRLIVYPNYRGPRLISGDQLGPRQIGRGRGFRFRRQICHDSGTKTTVNKFLFTHPRSKCCKFYRAFYTFTCSISFSNQTENSHNINFKVFQLRVFIAHMKRPIIICESFRLAAGQMISISFSLLFINRICLCRHRQRKVLKVHIVYQANWK